MALSTFSIFYYGFKVTSSNKYLNFDEGSGELTATIALGTYDSAGFAQAVQDALNAIGGFTYAVSFDRDDRRFTISAGSNFDLLTDSGTQSANAPWDILGFSTDADFSGDDSYTGDLNGGSAYRPQFILQDYQDPDTFQKRQDPSINESANGIIEVISFGITKFIDMSIKYITNIAQDGIVIKSNPNGVSDAVSFFEAITGRGKFEFMPDISDRDTFYTVILDDLDGSKNGTDFKFKELVGQSLPNYYEVNGITLRVVE